MTKDVVEAYREFWDTRKAIRARQRAELELELLPQRRALADAVWAERGAGSSVQDVANKLGLKNRNFVYQIQNDLPLVNKPASPATTRPKVASKKVKEYSIEREPENYIALVTVGKKEYAIALNMNNEIVEVPEDWYDIDLSDEDRQFYKDLIKEIENV